MSGTSKKSNDPTQLAIPLGVTVAILLVNCAEAVNIVFIFPFMAFMLEDMGFTGHRLGYYCGGLAASFCTGQFCSSVMWGWLSDRYGRKPTLVIGTLGTAVGTAIFGLATSYPQAVVGRITSGLLSGNLGILKTYLTEITDDNSRTRAFALLQTSGSIGNILGPLIGGLLSNPAAKFPSIFGQAGSIWLRYPYLFPCLICVANSAVASAMCHVFLKETRVFTVAARGDDKTIEAPMEDASRHSRDPGSRRVGSETYAQLDGTEHGQDEEKKHRQKDDEVEEKENENENENAIQPPVSISTETDEAYESAATPAPTPSVSLSSPSSSSGNVLRERVVVLATGTYGLLAFSYIVIDETLPLFMKLEEDKGGLGFVSAEIGFILSCSGAVMLLFNLLVLPRLGAFSKLRLFKLTNTAAIPFTMAWPLAGLANRHMVASGYWRTKSPFMYGLLLVTSSIKNTLAVMTFTAIIILVNHSVPSSHLGKVNGMGQMIAALARAAGPALGGAFWSISLKHDFVFLNFIFASLSLAACQFAIYRLPDSLDHRRSDGKEEVEGLEMAPPTH